MRFLNVKAFYPDYEFTASQDSTSSTYISFQNQAINGPFSPPGKEYKLIIYIKWTGSLLQLKLDQTCAARLSILVADISKTQYMIFCLNECLILQPLPLPWLIPTKYFKVGYQSWIFKSMSAATADAIASIDNTTWICKRKKAGVSRKR